jgi:Cu/Ag efflux protein CusF
LKRAIAIVFSVIFVLSCTGMASARMGMGKAMGLMPEKEVAGTVESVDQKAKTITVKGMRGPVTVTADEKTVVKMGKEVKTFSDIKVGDKVTLDFEVGEGKNVAKTIAIAQPTSAEPAAEKGAPTTPEEKK